MEMIFNGALTLQIVEPVFTLNIRAGFYNVIYVVVNKRLKKIFNLFNLLDKLQKYDLRRWMSSWVRQEIKLASLAGAA